jgi:hypothetical protein
MAIHLSISADTTAELRDQLQGLLAMTRVTSAEYVVTPQPDAPTESEPAAEPAKRGRKPKASAPVEDAQVVETPAAEPVVETPATPELTYADVQAVMATLIQKGADGAKASIKICTDLQAFVDGKPKLVAIKPEQYGQAIEMAKAAIAEIDAQPQGVM